jgi:hypothetical protein
MSSYRRMVGKTLPAFNAIISASGGPLDLSAYTVKFQMNQYRGTTVVVAETNSHITVHPTQSFAADATTNLITCVGHGVKDGNQIVLATSSALPGGLATATRYFPVQIGENTFALAVTANGQAIDITSAGTGTHTFYIVGSVQYAPQAADVATAGMYSAWFTAYSGSDGLAAPVAAEGIEVELFSFGA